MTATTTEIRTSGTRQLAVLATVAALGAMAALLFGTALSGITSRGSGLLIVTIGAMFLGFTLINGWVPGLYLSILMVAVGSIFVGERLELGRATILAITIIVVHETSRFSLDARKPTRLGRGLLLRTTLGGLLAVVVVAITATLLKYPLNFLIEGAETPLFWIPVALLAIAAPLFAVRAVELVTNRWTISPRTSGLLAGVFAIVVVLLVAAGAQSRQAVADDRKPVSEWAETDDAPEDLFYDEAVSGSLATLIGMFVAAGVLGLLYGAFNRQQILLEQDDIELDLDDSRFSLSLPDTVESEDVGLDIEATTALLDSLLVDLDAEQDPGRAIRYSYARVEQQFVVFGIERHDAETAHEFMARALPVLEDGSAIDQLTSLFERARFSTEVVPEELRVEARGVLGELMRQLGDIPPPVAEEPAEQ